MPFTLSHPAAALPFKVLPRKIVCMTGLIVGTLVPDFEYFLRMEMRSIYSHTFSGLFYFCLPVGLALCFIFHNIIRDPFINSLPRFLKARFYHYNIVGFDWNGYFLRRWFVVLPSIFAGAWTHTFWDSFTHGAQPDLQYLSTLIGAVAIIAAILFMPKNKNITGGVCVKYWAIFIVLFAVTMTICVHVFNLQFDINAAWRILINQRINGNTHLALGKFAANAMSAFFISLTLTSIIWKIILRMSAHDKR